ncbi:MAG: radical SAM protein [bacterium]
MQKSLNSTLKQINKISVKDVVLAVTYQCNSRCQFCNIWQNKETFSCEPSVYQNLPQTIRNVNISGGEPFLRKDLPEIVKTISRRCPKAKIIISTNGFMPSVIKEQMQGIIKFKKDIGVAVSLDGFGKVHEELRGFPGGFCLALETIRLLKELNIKNVKIAFTLGDKNINQIKRIYELSKELGVEFSFAVYHNSSHYFKKQDNAITQLNIMQRQISWLIDKELKGLSPKQWLRAYFAFGIQIFLRSKKRILPDYSGFSSLFIDPFGNIYPSDVWNLKIGQLQKIKDWTDFKTKANVDILNNQRPDSWMICTARQAIEKHWFRAIQWILFSKFNKIIFKNRIALNKRRKMFKIVRV